MESIIKDVFEEGRGCFFEESEEISRDDTMDGIVGPPSDLSSEEVFRLHVKKEGLGFTS